MHDLKGWPFFEEDEIQATVNVLRSGKINYWGGLEGREFEKEFAEYHQCSYGVAVANGTVALELALYALGIGSGDEVVTTPKTFLATTSSIIVRGAKPVFADVDPHSQNITAESIEAVLTPDTKAIICVHLAGWPCDMDSIMELAEKHKLFVIEDCAQAHGAVYRGKKIGSMGHISAFSFCQDKIMTTGGEGGMVLTNDEGLWKRAWSYKDHGKNYDTVYNKNHPPGFRWLHEEFGTNWRMTEMQAAIGRVQLRKLDIWLKKRRAVAALFNKKLSGIDGVLLPETGSSMLHSYYKYYIVLSRDYSNGPGLRNRIMADINANGVPCVVGSCSEIYNEICFKKHGLAPKRPLSNANYLTDATLVLPLHHNLNEATAESWVEVVRAALVKNAVSQSAHV